MKREKGRKCVFELEKIQSAVTLNFYVMLVPVMSCDCSKKEYD